MKERKMYSVVVCLRSFKKKILTTPSVGKNVEQQELSPLLMGV